MEWWSRSLAREKALPASLAAVALARSGWPETRLPLRDVPVVTPWLCSLVQLRICLFRSETHAEGENKAPCSRINCSGWFMMYY